MDARHPRDQAGHLCQGRAASTRVRPGTRGRRRPDAGRRPPPEQARAPGLAQVVAASAAPPRTLDDLVAHGEQRRCTSHPRCCGARASICTWSRQGRPRSCRSRPWADHTGLMENDACTAGRDRKPAVTETASRTGLDLAWTAEKPATTRDFSAAFHDDLARRHPEAQEHERRSTATNSAVTTAKTPIQAWRQRAGDSSTRAPPVGTAPELAWSADLMYPLLREMNLECSGWWYVALSPVRPAPPRSVPEPP